MEIGQEKLSQLLSSTAERPRPDRLALRTANEGQSFPLFEKCLAAKFVKMMVTGLQAGNEVKQVAQNRPGIAARNQGEVRWAKRRQARLAVEVLGCSFVLDNRRPMKAPRPTCVTHANKIPMTYFLSSTSITRIGLLPALKTSCVTLASRHPASPDLKFTVSSCFPFSTKPSEPSSRITPT